MHKIGGIDMETVKEMELSNLAMEWFVIPARKATLRLEAYTFHSTVSTQQKTTKTLCGTKTALN